MRQMKPRREPMHNLIDAAKTRLKVYAATFALYPDIIVISIQLFMLMNINV